MHHHSTSACASALLGAVAILTGSISSAAEIDIRVNAVTYVPFSSGLVAGTAIYLNADSNPAIGEVRAMQRSLGYREVDYKSVFSTQLAWSPLAPANITTSGSITTYDYSGQSNIASDLVGFWTDKNLPIVIGPDGKAYTTDGHHTTAGYLASTSASPRMILPGLEHIVVGHVIANYYDPANPSAPDDAFWLARQSENKAFLFGPNGSPLTQPTDPGYSSSTQPILPSTLAMPLVPGKASMTLDTYRSLAWGLTDAVVKSATTSAGMKIAGFSKKNPLTPGVDTNFVEFYWADFLRNRITWDDAKAGSAFGSGLGDANLVKAPLSFFTAVANGIALGKSEVYRDQFGRTVADYDTATYVGNTQAWAHATIVNGLAKTGETYHMYLRDDSTVVGEISPSALSTNKLHIDTTLGQTISGVLRNFNSVTINGGGTLETSWKDTALSSLNSTLTLPAGTNTVTLTASNLYTGTTEIVAGKLALSGMGAISQSGMIHVGATAQLDVTAVTVPFRVNASQSLSNDGTVSGSVDVFGTAGGGGVFSAKVTLESGAHLKPGSTVGMLTLSNGLTLENGGVLDFDLGSTSDLVRISGGIFDGSGPAGTTVNFSLGPGFIAGTTYTLIDWGGASAIDLQVSDFISPGTPSSFAIVGNTFQATIVPEPTLVALMSFGLLSMATNRSRKSVAA